jgi:hypothetical protein
LYFESLLAFDELAERQSVAGLHARENVINNFANAAQAVCRVPRPDAVSVARLGHPKILAGQTVSAEQLDASYIRRADAEIKKPVRTPA